MKLKSGAVGIAVVAAMLSGCNDEPTASDVKNNYKEIYKDCPVMTISDVKKLNGRPGEDRDYIVDVSFTLTMTPPKENAMLVEQSLKAAEAMQGEIDAARVRYQETMAKLQKLDDAQLEKDVVNPGPGIEIAKMRLSAASEFGDLEDKQRNLKPDSQVMMRKLADNIRKQCVIPNAWLGLSKLKDFVGWEAGKNLYTESQKTYSGQFHMVKTEKGWMIYDMLRR